MDIVYGHSANGTRQLRNLSLQAINDLQARRYYPVIGLLAVAMVIGVFGNLLVFCVYYTRFKRTPNNLLIMMLSVFDMLTGALQIPFEIADMLYPYMHGDIMFIPCKIFRFVGSSIVSGSALTIGCIALERFKKISDPLNPMGTTKTRIMMIGTVAAVVIASSPTLILYGYRTEPLTSYGTRINGSDCAIDDKFLNTPYPGIYGSFMTFLFFAYFFIYAYFYIRIAMIVRRRKNKKTGSKTARTNAGFSASDEAISSPKTDGPEAAELRVVSGVKVRTAKLTVMFLVISIVCVISFLPLQALNIVNGLIQLDEWRKYNPAVDIILEFCQKTFCLNTASNPIIYSLMNPAFRDACAEFFKYGCSKKRRYRQHVTASKVTSQSSLGMSSTGKATGLEAVAK